MQPASPKLRYIGPVLVRSEEDYHVLSLPDRLGLIVGSLTGQDCQDFAAAIRAERPGPADDGRIRPYCLVKGDVLREPAKPRDVMNRIKADPFEPVRVLGPKVFLEACSDRYRALGQYSNAVDLLHQAILLNSRNAGTYNSLAWMKATCSDASVRNGEEAISAASKGCELTEWKNWMFIDTLAAAYAEAGDFKRAIEFQEQALRTGDPGESKQKMMRERLSLYKQSQPFRENR